MRFAGQRVSDFTGGVAGVEDYMADSPDYGKNAMAASNIAREETTNSIGRQSDVANAGIMSAADAEAAKITGAAASAVADAQGQASIMSGIGQIGGALIGGINVGGGGSQIGVDRTSSGMGIAGSVAPKTKLPYYGPAW